MAFRCVAASSIHGGSNIGYAPRVSLFLYQIRPVRPEMPLAPTTAETELIGQHFAYLKARFESGGARWVGRTDNAPFLGLALVEAESLGAAEAFLANDPAVKGGVFAGIIQPYIAVF